MGAPAELEGVVVFSHAPRGMIFLHDATGGVAVSLGDARVMLPATGERVKVTGMTAAGLVAPLVRASAIVTQGKTELPAAREISYEQGMTGAEEAQWVELRGRLVQAKEADGWLSLSLEAPMGAFAVSIPTTEPFVAEVGADLRVRGVCNVWVARGQQRIGGIYLFSPSLAQVQVVARAGAADPTLTIVSQVQRLRAEEAKAGKPVRLRGVVTFVHPDQHVCYLNDATGGVLVWFENKSTPLPAVGDSLTVRGITSAGAFSAAVQALEVAAAAPQPPPAPRVIGMEQALSGAEDGQWVEMRGHLRQVDLADNWLRLALTTAAGEFTVSIPQPVPTNAKAGSFLIVRGVCQAWLNEKRQIGGVFLYAPSLEQIAVAEAPPADPFAVPEESIGNLPNYRTKTLQQQQVRISGVVLHHVPGRYVVVENASGVVRALSRGEEPLAPGDRVEVAGVPGRHGNRALLRGAVYRRTGAGDLPSPLALRGELKPAPALEGRLVTVTGTIVSLLRRPDDVRLLVQTERPVLEAVAPGKFAARETAGWETGSRVEVTGLYNVEYDEDDQPVKWSLQLRSPADLVVRERPSWWTLGRALTGLGVIGGCLVVGLAWVVVLRRQVRRQTDVIRAQLEKEAALESRHGEIVENASDFIFSTDLAGRFTSFNAAGERLTGFNRTEALALGLQDLLAPENGAAGPKLLALVRQTGPAAAAQVEACFKTRDGRLVWMETSARLLRDSGKPTGLLGIARDITARRETEEQQRRLEALNRHVQKTESLGRMAGAIAHHFNNQLQSVLMSLQMTIEDLPPQSEAVAILSTALGSARNAAEMSTLMLTYLGQSTGERLRLDLGETCRGQLAALRPQLPAGATVEFAAAEPGIAVRAVADQLRRVLANLVANAVEAGGGGAVAVRVFVRRAAAAEISAAHRFPIDFEPQATDYACLEIGDTGCGIPEANIDKLFDPFFSTKFTGRGMGLPVALGIARGHDGAVTVESTPGRGSVFRLYLPVAG